ncbi:hypothetical protein BC829DRAFT_440077 [Chytridium lagenaria]|nr:hypothetical protein BC829DRAFT_440077 [Chytridium lagenaria]
MANLNRYKHGSPQNSPLKSPQRSPKPISNKATTSKGSNSSKTSQKPIRTSGKSLKSLCLNPSINVELLKLVLDLTPFAAGYTKWQAVVDGLRAVVTDFGENHKQDSLNSAMALCWFDTLVDFFKKEEVYSLRASGTDKEYKKSEQLSTKILEVMGVDPFAKLIPYCLMEFHELKTAEKNEKERAEAQNKEAKGEAIVRAASMGLVKTSGKGKRGNSGDTEKGGMPLVTLK